VETGAVWEIWVYFLLYLFICSLFNYTVSNSHYTVSNNWMIVNNTMEGMWKC
jgi:hypothetical protein